MTVRSMDTRFDEIVAAIEPLEDLDTAWDWAEFFGGIGLGSGIIGVLAAGIAIT